MLEMARAQAKKMDAKVEWRQEDAGFQDIDIQIVSLTIQHDNAATFIPGLMASLPFAEAIAALDEPNQNALFNDVIEGLSPYIDGQRLAIPHVAHVVSAHTWSDESCERLA